MIIDCQGDYERFLYSKSNFGANSGFEPLWMPDFLFDFQKHLVSWALRKGRAAVFADCGLGKTPMQLVWAENIVRKTGGRVLILTPLAVAAQTCQEAAKFGIEAHRTSGELHPGINVTNYDKLHLFNASDFVATVCDESSILKHYTGATQKQVTRFMSKQAYRSLWTATAAPNDYFELGTSSEALGELGHTDMLGRFFAMDDKKRCRKNDINLLNSARRGNHFAKLAYRVSQQIGAWRLKPHAEKAFWRWVCSWAIACRRPSDLGYDDAQFILPALKEREHVVDPKCAADGMLFTLPAFGLREEREERRRTLTERCEHVASLINGEPAVVWCHMNNEGDRLAEVIENSIQVSGADSDEAKEEAYLAFSSGEIKRLITKPKIGAWGMNWQHCSHVVTFASHSYEQYYQSIRRCWRFGQTKPVTADIVFTKGEQYVAENMARKARACDQMFAALLEHMREAQSIQRRSISPTQIEIPQWIAA